MPAAPRKAPVRRAGARRSFAAERRVSLCETLDRVLNKGAVVVGDIVISVAGVDLLYVGLNLVISSVETMRLAAAERQSSARLTEGTARPEEA